MSRRKFLKNIIGVSTALLIPSILTAESNVIDFGHNFDKKPSKEIDQREIIDFGHNFGGVVEFDRDKALEAIKKLDMKYPHINYYMNIGEDVTEDGGIPTINMKVETVMIGGPSDLLKAYDREDFKNWIDPDLKNIMPRKGL